MIAFLFRGAWLTANQKVALDRGNRFGAGAKRKAELNLATSFAVQRKLELSADGVVFPLPYKVIPSVHWVVTNRRSDPDNIASSIKVLLDALVEAGVLAGDRLSHIEAIGPHTYEVGAEPSATVYLDRSWAEIFARMNLPNSVKTFDIT